MSLPPCPRCSGTQFMGIPDSLASACCGCGFVWVGFGKNVRPGATLQEWAADVYEAHKSRDEMNLRDTKDGT